MLYTFHMDRLEKMRKGLYARERDGGRGEGAPHGADTFHTEADPPRGEWVHEPTPPPALDAPPPERFLPMLKKIFIGSVVFFVLASVVTALVVWRGGNIVSSEKVAIQFSGPLSVAHARQAAVGDALANVLSFLGFSVKKEYYLNDEGNQIDILGKSVELRLKELSGEKIDFPEIKTIGIVSGGGGDCHYLPELPGHLQCCPPGDLGSVAGGDR